MKKILASAFLVAFLARGALAMPAPDSLDDPAQEARARALQKEFRCLVCQGESLDESNAPLAADLRRLIRERIARGDSDVQIEHYLVARYGNFILMKPPFEADTYLLWLGPFLVLILGGAIMVIVVIRAQKASRPSP
jgi:cytochrome c-type biogenesis protein CcmH